MNSNFDSIGNEGMFMSFSKCIEKQTAYKHVFCGENGTSPSTCPNCNKPLLQFFSFDARDQRLGLSECSFTRLPLVYCWQCSVSQHPFIYSINTTGENINYISYGKGDMYFDFPYKNYPVSFAESSIQFVPLSSLEQKIIKQYNRNPNSLLSVPEEFRYLFRPQIQYGGEPYLCQFPLNPLFCPICCGNMFFLCSVTDNAEKDYVFTGNDYVQVLYFLCPVCSVITAIQMCD